MIRKTDQPIAPRPHGFTLVEILIVVLILGILAALVVPRFASASADAAVESTAMTVRNVQTMILHDFAEQGSYPAAIDNDWFAGQGPQSPYADGLGSVVQVDTDSDSGKTHPETKTVQTSGSTAEVFWYNPANGVFRGLVPAGVNDAETLDRYNEVNKVQLTDVSATR